MQTDSRPTFTCSVLNKTAPPVHGADGTQSIRTRLNPAKPYQAAKNQTDSRCQNASRTGHGNFAYSALACFRMGRIADFSEWPYSLQLLRQAHTAQQVFEAPIGAQSIESWIYGEPKSAWRV